MNFSRLFLMMALGVSLNNVACGMKDDNDNNRKLEDQVSEQSNKYKQTKVYDDKASQELFKEVDQEKPCLNKIRGLLEKNANPNVKIKKNLCMMILHDFAFNNDVANAVLCNGNENVVDHIGKQVFITILRLGGKFLYRYIKAQKIYGFTPLHRAVFRSNEECVQLLLDNGADLNAQDKKGSTPLHTAVLNDKEECVEIIINHIKSLALVKSPKNFAHLCLVDKNFKEQVRIFLLINNRKKKAGLKIPRFLCLEIISIFFDPSLLLQQLVNNKNKNGETPLTIARTQGYDKIVTLLEPYKNKETKSSISHCILN